MFLMVLDDIGQCFLQFMFLIKRKRVLLVMVLNHSFFQKMNDVLRLILNTCRGKDIFRRKNDDAETFSDGKMMGQQK